MPACRAGSYAARALRDNRRGRIAAVHRRAANLLLADGALVTLLPVRAPLHPWALGAPLAGPVLARLPEGAAVYRTDDTLEIGPLTFPLAALAVADLSLRDRPRAQPAVSVRFFESLLPDSEDGGPFATALALALARFDEDGDEAALADLVGLGEGLTPAGDDVIVGVLAGLDLFSGSAARALAARRRLVAALPAAGARTTRLSAQMLSAAAAGFYAEPLLVLLTALAQAPAPYTRLTSAAAGLLAMGHRSGADTLRGVLAALRWSLASSDPARLPRARAPSPAAALAPDPGQSRTSGQNSTV